MHDLKRVLVIGGNGFVGGHLVEVARAQGFDVAVADTADLPSSGGIPYFKVDVGNKAGVLDLFQRYRPHLAVNVAAIADIDLAEANHALADRVNVEGAGNCAAAAVATGARYTWFSSDAVYDGVGRDFTETSPLAPVNYYGRTKQLGEEAVRAACPDATILRLSLVLGFPLVNGNSFLAGLADKLSRGSVVPCPLSEVRTPVDVRTLCSAVLELDRCGFSGVLNLGATGSIDRYALTKKLAEGLGGNAELVIAQTAVDPVRAPRHANGIISVTKALGVLRETRLKSIDETVAEALRTAIGKERE
jgi:dTDP-4-dehydrorhamnose reductase